MILEAANMRNDLGRTVLRWAARVGHPESIMFIINSLPEAERMQAVCTRGEYDGTELHYAVVSGNLERIRAVLCSLPESQRLHVVNMKDQGGNTVLDITSEVATETILELVSESGHFEDLQSLDHVTEHCNTGAPDVEQPKVKRQRIED